METISCALSYCTFRDMPSSQPLRVFVAFPRLKRFKRHRLHCSSVLNVSAKQSSAEELQMQLEALMEEAKEARDKANKARTRFMRLTEAVEQISLRAATEMKAGNEAEARKLLIEKKNIMFALELSKRRSQVLEELASKLNEVMSKKETSLIAALAWATNVQKSEETTDVRFVSPPPKDDGDAELEPLRREAAWFPNVDELESSAEDVVADANVNNVSFENYILDIDGNIGDIERKLETFLEVGSMLARQDEKLVLARQLLGDLRRARTRIRKVVTSD